jgi:hypothetical protein
MCLVTSYESTAKWETSDFKKGQNGGAHLAAASVTKTTTLIGISRAAVSKVMMAMMGGHCHLRETAAKNQN